MAEYGEWNRKGATLSDVTAKKEYGVGRDFIVKGIRVGKLEYREGTIWGNPYLRLLRSQLEQYIAEEPGKDRLSSVKKQTGLRKIRKEIANLKNFHELARFVPKEKIDLEVKEKLDAIVAVAKIATPRID